MDDVSVVAIQSGQEHGPNGVDDVRKDFHIKTFGARGIFAGGQPQTIQFDVFCWAVQRKLYKK